MSTTQLEKRTRRLRNAFTLLLAVIGLFAASCTFLLTKEPLSCATNADCAKYPGTVCEESECRIGNAQVDSGTDSNVTNQDSGSDVDTGPPSGDPCLSTNKPVVELKGDIEENLTLKCDKDYLLVGRVAIKQPFTLTVTAGTTVYGSVDVEPVTNVQGTLIITPGARIVAVGTADKPVIFTSSKKRGPQPSDPDAGAKAGDWGGIFVLGEAPVNIAGGKGNKPGLGPWGDFGGSKPNNDSGRLEYVRIEYGGAKFPAGQDGVSLDLAGVGDQTVIDHVMFRFPGDDCVEIIGGTVNIKHMLCQYPFDDGIAWENGWVGKVQFIVVQGRPLIDNNSNGLQGRSGNTAPISNPFIYNGTFCGQNSLPTTVRDNQQYGIRGDSFTHFHVINSIFMGWEATVDLRGTTIAADVALGSSDAGTGIEFRNSLAYQNVAANVAYNETAPPPATTKDPFFDDDNAFDENAWWKSAANNNSEANPAIPKCFDPKSPRFAASGPIGATSTGAGSPLAATPPNDGFFDPNAKYLGAFKDQNDNWATGNWVLWNDF